MTDYSRGDYADLPAGKTDLENNYTAPDLTAIASNDNSTYAEQTANNEIAIHQYKKTVTGQYTNITWSGKSSLAPSESPVIMEVYNVDLAAWEELDRDDSTAADTDFDITYNNLATADYLDSGVITWRVYQAASAPGGGIDYRASAASDPNNDTAGNITVPKPTGTVDGDLLIACVASRDLTNQVFPTITPPSGWSATFYTIDTTITRRTCFYWKVASSEGSSWTWTTTALDRQDQAVCIALSGAAVSSPVDICGNTGEVYASGSGPYTYTVPSVDITVSGDWLLDFYVFEDGTLDDTSNYLPSGNTKRVFSGDAGGTGYWSIVASTRGPIASTGATGADTTESTLNQVWYIGAKVAVKPA